MLCAIITHADPVLCVTDAWLFRNQLYEQSHDCHVISYRHFVGLLKSTGGTVVCGGETDEATRYIAPTVINDAQLARALACDVIKLLNLLIMC